MSKNPYRDFGFGGWFRIGKAHVELFFGQELGNISSYAPSGVPTQHTTSSLSVKA
ncbi:hypothetical protein MTR_5g040070 [Medicago truncatula]|uniref:Uncharacterized protein n=1 Tax=Medicago truncatula TaxID=3880 RepID=G7KDV7_MEDTR|nr:hypothetical protein MTR_5g040070 [Medicago truncatula]